MCYIISYVHDDCGHEKKAELVEYCEDSEEGTCILIPVHFKEITAPSLCLSCFREQEAKIDAEYQFHVECIRRRMADYEATQADRQIRGRAQGAADPNIAELEQDLKDAKELRDLEIRMFRDRQGVWGDG